MRDQLGHIAAELMRGANAQKENKPVHQELLERALELVDLSLSDPKWQPNILQLLLLRNEIAKAYIDNSFSIENVLAVL